MVTGTAPDLRRLVPFLTVLLIILSSISIPSVKGATLVGLVTDGVTNDPIEGADVHLFDIQYNFERATSRTDENGSFRMEDLLPANYRIEIEKEGFFPVSSEPFELTEGQELVIFFDLEPIISRIRGRVTDHNTGEPLYGALVMLRDYTTRDLLRAMPTNENGNYLFEPLEPGQYTLEISMETYNPAVIYNMILYPDQERVQDIALSPIETSISGTITNARTGTLVREATVQLLDADSGEELNTFVTGFPGTYRFTDLEPGHYNLTVRSFGFLPARVNGIVLDLYEQEQINFPLTPIDTRISGTVTDLDTGEPLEEVRVELLAGINAEPVRSTLTGEDGGYSFLYLDEGDYDIRFSAVRYMPYIWENVTLAIYDDVQVDYSMQATPTPTIQELQSAGEPNEWVTIHGIITVPSNTLYTDRLVAYLQDESGYGIMLYDDIILPPEANINRGDELLVTGRYTDSGFHGMSRLLDLEYIVLSSGQMMPEPYRALTGEINESRSREGSFVEITGELQDTPLNNNSYSFGVDDGSGQVLVRIHQEANLDLGGFFRGDGITVRGVIGYNQGYLHVYPSLQEDIIAGVSVENKVNGSLPEQFGITDCFPNPFNAEVRISVSVPTETMVTAEIYDLLGQQITLLQNRTLPQGFHLLRWRANGFASGVYLLKVSSSSGQQDTRRLLLLK